MSTTAPDCFADIADDPHVGGKARSLARLRAAGLPTPSGFVITDGLFRALVADTELARRTDPAAPHSDAQAPRPSSPGAPPGLDAAWLARLDEAAAAVKAGAWPDGFADELRSRLAALGAGPFSVRSSFVAEDAPGAVAAGVYESRVAVAAADVLAAVRQVLASAVGAGAAAYALARGQNPAAAPVAVLIHRYIEGDSVGSAAGDEDEVVLDVHARTDAGSPAPAASGFVTAVVRALAAEQGPVEIEWTARDDQVVLLQLRPYAPPNRQPRWPGFDELPAGERPDDWHWDAAHNPLPLSPAQAGLVALVEARCRIGLRQRVLGGYLFWSRVDLPADAPSIEPAQLTEALATLGHDVDIALTALGPAPALAPTLDLFCTFYQRIFGAIQPAARRARAALDALIARHAREEQAAIPTLLTDVESAAQERHRLAERLAHAASEPERQRALAGYLARFGDESPAWDLATPTHRERPRALLQSVRAGSSMSATEARPDWQVIADRIGARLPASAQADWFARLSEARSAVAAGETDDWLYARLQTAVRRALLALGQRLTDAGVLEQIDDIFFLSLDRARALDADPAATADNETESAPAAQAIQARAVQLAAQAAPPPLHPTDPTAGLVRGAGTGGRALGRVVHRTGPQGDHPPPDAVLVATTLLPTELPLLHVAALVTETGGPLDHVAAQSRERGLPAVVGARGAGRALPEGALVLVDADAGLVVLIAPP